MAQYNIVLFIQKLAFRPPLCRCSQGIEDFPNKQKSSKRHRHFEPASVEDIYGCPACEVYPELVFDNQYR